MIVLAQDTRQSPRPDVNVTQPKYKEMSKISRAFSDAFADSSIILYVHNNADPSFIKKQIRRFRIYLHIFVFMRTKIFLTVEGGVAGVIATRPGKVSKSHDPLMMLGRLLLKVVRWKVKYEAKRLKEFDDKVNEAVKNTLGDRVNEMWYIDALFTAPSSQGQGYGSALLDAVTSQADKTSQMTWLKSSDTVNTAFYSSHGFMIVTEVVLGDQNPTWSGAPVVITIMLRQPRINSEITYEKAT